MKKIFLIPLTFFASLYVYSQNSDSIVYDEPIFLEDDSKLVEETFHSTRIINGHSVETLKKGTLEFRIEHKFGDFAGVNGGSKTLFGLDQVSDVRIAFEYGVTDKLMCGIGRSKGGGLYNPYKQLLDGFVKYRILHQEKGKMPISMAFIGTSSYTYAKKTGVDTLVSNFPKQNYRLAYCSQLNIATKIKNKVSLAIMPTLLWRNYVAQKDQNLLFSIGSAISVHVSKKMALTAEYYYNINNSITRKSYQNSFALAVDWMTFGHNFKIYLANAQGFGETQFIPYTDAKWNKGGFRLGFCVGRKYMRE
ncbi:MAG: hypothetical protein HYR91_09170 [Flavobacteriia bacterium]|nr:hypothetical protein [Flavobacteriia bacterium]